MKEKTAGGIFLIAAALINVVNINLVLWSVASMYLYRGDGNMAVNGARVFIYFTIDSNILGAVSGLPVLFCAVRGAAEAFRPESDKRTIIPYRAFRVFPRGIVLLHYAGTAAVSVTLLTVLFFLGPMLGYGPMFAGKNLYLHLICPVLCIISFCFLVREYKITMPETLVSVLPTFLYGIVYVRQVIFLGFENGGWHDFYGFNQWGTWHLSALIMLLGTWAAGLILRILHNHSQLSRGVPRL